VAGLPTGDRQDVTSGGLGGQTGRGDRRFELSIHARLDRDSRFLDQSVGEENDSRPTGQTISAGTLVGVAPRAGAGGTGRY
jgi:hypothetical protein